MLTIVSLQHAAGPAVPLEINRYHTNVAINNQLAKTKIDQVFANPNDFEVDGIYIFPVLVQLPPRIESARSSTLK